MKKAPTLLNPPIERAARRTEVARPAPDTPVRAPAQAERQRSSLPDQLRLDGDVDDVAHHEPTAVHRGVP
jgi:hypothetical protein